MNAHKDAANDILVALRSGYPKKLKYKAYQRLATAYTNLKENEKARDAYKLLLESLQAGIFDKYDFCKMNTALAGHWLVSVFLID